MSHIITIEIPDKWNDLSGLPEDVAKSVELARDTAIDIIEKLEPEHISSFADLIAKLKNALINTKRRHTMINKIDRTSLRTLQKLNETLAKNS